MSIATMSLRTPIPSLLFFSLITLAGIYGFRQLHIQDLPDIDLPEINTVLSLPGAGPSQLETEVARKVEDSLATVSGVKHINTSITDGRVAINTQFRLEKNLSDALIETKDAIDRLRSDLPSNLEAPVISAVRSSSSPLITYAISSTSKDEADLSWFVDDIVSKKILSISGVGKFERIGGTHREIKIEINPIKLASLNVTVADISESLKNVQLEVSGGRSTNGGKEHLIRVVATVTQAKDLALLAIPVSDGKYVRLNQVATIVDSHAERTQLALLNGEAVVGFKIYRAKGFDEADIESGVQEVVKSLKEEHTDLELLQINNKVTRTIDQYKGSMQMLYEGAILAVLVVWFFLRDWRATMIAATALPLSIIPTYAAMYWLGYSLNTLTLLAQAVVVGILVDDAIVEIENIVRHKNMGKSVLQAVSDAVNEIALAVMATTFTIVVVFIPTSLMSGVGGLFFKQFGWTVVISVLMSLLVARLLTPVMALYFLKDKPVFHKKGDGCLMRYYLNTVRWCLRYRKTTLFLAGAFMVLTFSLTSFLPTGFLPDTDEGFTTVGVELPPGSTLSDSIETVEALRYELRNVDGIAHVFSLIGQGGEDITSAELRKSNLMILFAPLGDRPSQTEIENEIQHRLKVIPGARFSLESSNSSLSIILASDNVNDLISTAKMLEKNLRDLNYLSNIRSTASLERPEVIIQPYLERSAELGITTADIATVLRMATIGDFNSLLPKLNFENRQVYVRTYMPNAYLKEKATIQNLRIPTEGGSTTLSNIANISMGTGPSQIDRYDRRRYITINADLLDQPLGTALNDVRKLATLKKLPESVELIESGDAELMNELFSGLGIAMLTGILCVYCVLVLLFNDFFQPTSILSALPLSLGGSVIALLITGSELSLVALIGIVMLMGIVAKNSILLVDYTIMNINHIGMSLLEALVDACHKRAQPIVMTTIAMVAGMLPITLGFGGDASFRQPMAIAVIGGLLTSTALSLLVVPVVFTYIHGAEAWFKKQMAQRPKTVSSIGEI